MSAKERIRLEAFGRMKRNELTVAAAAREASQQTRTKKLVWIEGADGWQPSRRV